MRSPIVKRLSIPTYANNTEALAGGLIANDLYKTAGGVVMITL